MSNYHRSNMLQSVEGIYRNGKIELLEMPADIEEAQVIVTFLPKSGLIDLPSRGIDREQASDLRLRLTRFAPDWERPEMDAYDALSSR
ncbi:hypothetical protein [Microcoleus sp. EPA2]|uniref:hypothetical protein n=1 Tax=Microcoleus sp. EPA2 TaxID=2841654 RepID=UPI00312B3DC3